MRRSVFCLVDEMTPTRNRHKLAKWSFTLVWWVIFVCLAQNAGVFNLCSLNYSLEEQIISSGNQKENVSEQCDLSEKLINAHFHQLDDAPLLMFIFALFIFAWFMPLPTHFAPFTEPIVHKRRIHLTLCVFRE